MQTLGTVTQTKEEKRYLVTVPPLSSRAILLLHLSFALRRFWKVPVKKCFKDQAP